MGPWTVLGIETSCDETAAAVVTGTPGRPGTIRANVVLSQLGEHAPYGGVVPEIAARAHVEVLDGLIARALAEAGCTLADIDAVAATAGPGLIGGVIVGLLTGKGLALAAGKPLIAVNHLEGHALSARLVADCPFPYLLLLVSGGHCQLVGVEALGRYRVLGTTLDDAVGEAFDKVAKLLGLGYPGGPAVERLAGTGDPAALALPRPLLGRPGCDFSFSGLKTAVRQAVEGPDPPRPADMAASFQATVSDILADRTARALGEMREWAGGGDLRLVVAGGVASNRTLRARLQAVADAAGARLILPPPALCTDNAAMIAWAGLERLSLGLTDPLDAPARARWPLATLTGAGA